MAWAYLLIAGLFEVGWPIGLKLSARPGWFAAGIAFAILCLAASGYLLWLAQRTIPIGTAYAVWTGVGATGTFAIGILFFNDSASPLRLLSATLIVAGMVGLKLAHS